MTITLRTSLIKLFSLLQQTLHQLFKQNVAIKEKQKEVVLHETNASVVSYADGKSNNELKSIPLL